MPCDIQRPEPIGGRKHHLELFALRRISSKATFYYKRVLPIIFLAIPLLMLALEVLVGLRSGEFPPLLAIILPATMVAIVYLILKATILNLVDGVWDDGDALVVRNGAAEEQIALSNIKNVSYTALNPSAVTLSLRAPCKFGARVTFTPLLRLIPFLRSPIIDALINRIDAARSD